MAPYLLALALLLQDGPAAAVASDGPLATAIPRKQDVAPLPIQGGTVTARDLTHGVRAYRNDPDAAERALSALVEAGIGRWEVDAHGPKGGRPAQRFRLVSTVTVTETPANAGNDVGYGDGDTGDTPTDAGDGWGEL